MFATVCATAGSGCRLLSFMGVMVLVVWFTTTPSFAFKSLLSVSVATPIPTPRPCASVASLAFSVIFTRSLAIARSLGVITHPELGASYHSFTILQIISKVQKGANEIYHLIFALVTP
jgi:hypothetical protein